MSFERITARFIVPDSSGPIVTPAQSFSYFDFDENSAKRISEEASLYEIFVESKGSYEDERENLRTYHTTKSVSPVEMTSLSSPSHSTADVIGDIIVIGGRFAGVAIRISTSGGGTWDFKTTRSCTAFFKDGKVSGPTKSSYSSSTESHSDDDDTCYTLRLKK